MKRISAIAAMLALCLGLSSHAALAAVPGDACSPNGAAGVNGVMQMTCTSGVWVLNALKLGNSSVTCNSSNAGYIRWNGSTFQGCNGTNWRYLYGTRAVLSWATLSAYNGSCIYNQSAVTACIAACDGYCAAMTYTGGFIAQWAMNDATCVCVP